jgi:hypothetical protein
MLDVAHRQLPTINFLMPWLASGVSGNYFAE